MKLTRVERWVIANQYMILAKLYPEEADYYERQREAIASGYEFEYEQAAQQIYDDKDCLSSDECREVIHVLAMYDDLQRSFDALTDKSAVKQASIKFPGFSGNDETSQLGYCRHFCANGRKFARLNRGDDFDGHFPMLDAYRRMLVVWEPLSKQGLDVLSARQMNEILLAAAHPQSPTGKLVAAETKGSVQ